MGIASAEEYQRVLAKHHVVFLLFVSAHCPACRESGPLFERTAAQHANQVKSMVLDTTQTPRHPDVIRLPTLLVFRAGQMVEKLEGLGAWNEQEHTLNALFSRYATQESGTAQPG
ncbi:thioredoxin family protein [Pseudomonas sp. B6002]|uniref:thioredoxin family protein n=1 Tax=Pseudomonas sp. B6002 TaxID=2726978 RepID=UPI0015A342ED|nr:thioredoxin family protein [Pseudomonas sp. B6002]NVZ50455.1 thioredoxin family protein [Pseudomonas sp. B6002]